MLKNYFKIAFRSIRNNKVYSSINIIGLATGMAVTLLIGLWIWDEISFDSYHKNHSKIAEIMIYGSYKNEHWVNNVVMVPLADGIRSKFGEDFKYTSLFAGTGTHVVGIGEKKLSSVGTWVQEDFPKMFSLVMRYGSPDALKNPTSLLISQSLATALFGKTDPIGKTVKIDNSFDLQVAGVYEDLPHNSTFSNQEMFLPWTSQQNWFYTSDVKTNWDNHCVLLYAQLNDHVDMKKVSAQIKSIPTEHIKEVKEEAMLYPLDRLHLHGDFQNGEAVGGRIQFVWLFGIIGTFVLLLACINFMNLSTARSEKRAKEVGIRKTIGSMRSQLIGQFLCESILVSLFSFLLSILLVQLSLKYFNQLASKQISILWSNPVFWTMILGFTIFTGIISGSYPAFYLSAFKPIKVLKGVFRSGRFASLPRKVLVVLQFTVSIALIIGTIIVFKQIQFAKSRPVNYSRQGLIAVGMNTPDLFNHTEAIRADLLQTGAVENMGLSSSATTEINSNNGGFGWRGKDPNLLVGFGTINVSADFGKTIGWKIIQGRDFSRDFKTDSSGIIINESAAKILGFKNPVGEVITYRGNIFNNSAHTVIGVIKDMVMESPYDTTRAVMFFNGGWMNIMQIRINSKMPTRQALSKIEAVFKKYNPSSPFTYQFVDDDYATKFAEEERVGNLATLFAVLAILISCLGLFGLASFVAEQRTKEIGVRKVLGASVFNLWKLLSTDFVRLVIISCFISIPVAWYVLNAWLQRYIYRTDISWWVFAAASIGALITTLLTVSYQSIRAALSNPVKSLRTE